MSSSPTTNAYDHAQIPSLGILVTNLGTPDAPTPKAVRRYLAEFLWDPRVIEMPRLPWWLLLHGLVLNTRPRRSAHAYGKIWTEAGSPLLMISKQQAAALQAVLTERYPAPIHVELGMRYGNPAISAGLQRLRDRGVRRLLVLPLYPQYSAPATASTFDAVAAALKTWRFIPELRMVNSYHDDPAYVTAIVNSINEAWLTRPRPQRLLFSFHGLPKQYFLDGDPYFCQCQKTARLVAQQLDLTEHDWLVTFQSRLGPREWLQPYTDATLRRLAQEGIGNVDIVCPGFAADCLETLEEIKLLNRDIFLQAGGKQFNYIPALNERPEHIDALTQIVARHAAGWPELAHDWDAATAHRNANDSEQRARRVNL
jgi:protoporphyrin/coproporphyrin ferrochelatase